MGEKKGIVFALCLVFALFLVGGVYAYVFEMSEIPSSVQKGEIVSVSFSVSPGEGETLAELDKFGYFSASLSGPAYFGDYCSFFPNGTLRYECGLEIMKTQDEFFYVYAIDINTSQYVAGEYYFYVSSRIGYNHYFVGEGEFNITAENLPMKSCSIRASGGESGVLFFEDGEQAARVGNNKLNFNIVVRNGKVMGEGYLTSQYDRHRSSYKFKIARILENNNDNAVIAVGYGRGSYVYEDALIFLDKKNNVASMKGMWPEVSNMQVSLMKGC
ncbi:hypothetical protein COV15_00525 [Candidatus Woesearchaeota archaeon CG10_big_fil_rev_8_21_14_0_10_34_12]|nr:MAG: hypothetical protein COV15_00525 [Candidatus Woesearchaeota archaeon CG10_big_fil_rev_8_21_14_0_10_34_12]